MSIKLSYTDTSTKIKNKEAKMQRKANKKDRHFNHPEPQIMPISDTKYGISMFKIDSKESSIEIKNEVFEELYIGEDIHQKQQSEKISIYSKTKTILCQIFCFWK